MSSQNRRATKFNKYETKLFLELYSMEKVLYNPDVNEYRDKHSRAAAINRISHKLNIPGFGPKDVIIKFKNLRSAYCLELKKITKSKISATNEGDIYKPRVFWFEHMDAFIRPFVQQRVTQSNMVTNILLLFIYKFFYHTFLLKIITVHQ